jgi:hypothetical protein
VEFGYKISDKKDDDTYIGIMFGFEVPKDLIVEGTKLVQWAAYTQMDASGMPSTNNMAVACISVLGKPEETEVKTYNWDSAQFDGASIHSLQ